MILPRAMYAAVTSQTDIAKCRKTSNTSPRRLLEQVAQNPWLLIETRLVSEIRLVFEVLGTTEYRPGVCALCR